MVEYFATKGKLILKNNEPVVFTDGSEKSFLQEELILWTTLHWNFLNKQSLEEAFKTKMKRHHINTDTSFEETLNRLRMRGLIVSKSDYLASDALYNLIKDLYVVPLGTTTILKRMIAFIYLIFIKGMSFHKCKEVAENFKVSDFEKRIIKFSKKFKVTVAELIRINERDLWNIISEDEIVPLAYEENENMNSLGISIRFSESKIKVTEAIVNLYLKKQIVFE